MVFITQKKCVFQVTLNFKLGILYIDISRSENTCSFILSISQMESRKGDSIDESTIGGNASQEEQQEAMEGPGVQTGIDLVLNHRLEDMSQFFTDKKAVQSYLKKYVKQ